MRAWLWVSLSAGLVCGAGCYVDRSGADGFTGGIPRSGCVEECRNGGVCVGSQCFCGPVDFEGPTCEERVDNCASVDCIDGQCVDLVRNFVCDCEESWTTDSEGLCTVEIEDCQTPNACINGVCDDTQDNVVCACFAGYQGANCSAPVNCGQPPDPPEDAVRTSLTGTEFGDAATFACAPGFQGAPTTVTCGPDATWGVPTIACIDVPGCGPPPPIPYGRVSTPQGTDVGDSAFYTCDSGFHLVKYVTNSALCLETEEWGVFSGGCFLVGTCAENPCVFGDCTELADTVVVFECFCDPGWTGPRCDM
ncbi:MAG: hypothetical protein WBG86_08910 [Polyangiales bacterium]